MLYHRMLAYCQGKDLFAQEIHNGSKRRHQSFIPLNCGAIPNELLDAARVDGAGEFHIYRRIVLPQLGPALATFGMLTFMFNWNAYLWPLIILTEERVRTLPIILTWFANRMVSNDHLTMAASVLVVLPVLIVFLFVQRWIVEGITLSGMKG